MWLDQIWTMILAIHISLANIPFKGNNIWASSKVKLFTISFFRFSYFVLGLPLATSEYFSWKRFKRLLCSQAMQSHASWSLLEWDLHIYIYKHSIRVLKFKSNPFRIFRLVFKSVSQRKLLAVIYPRMDKNQLRSQIMPRPGRIVMPYFDQGFDQG